MISSNEPKNVFDPALEQWSAHKLNELATTACEKGERQKRVTGNINEKARAILERIRDLLHNADPDDHYAETFSRFEKLLRIQKIPHHRPFHRSAPRYISMENGGYIIRK